ncbi:MAG: DUF3696 domain-containing protein [Planctomycetota bacterium]|jgi:predicted ATPase|nr:DUF3696 domain-containing protein [Planctomycetota bacterium]
MLTRLRIRNFKGWKDTGEIRLAPLTLFFGTNSSGKSSLGQFLMLLKQTAESPDRKAIFQPGGKNSAVQLGSFKEMVFRRKAENRISFDYQWILPEPFSLKDPGTGRTLSGDALSFSAEVGGEGEEGLAPRQRRLSYQLFQNGAARLKIGMSRKAGEGDEFVVSATPHKLKWKRRQRWPLGAPIRFYGFPDEVAAYYQSADFVQELNLQQEKLFRRLSYLGPLRTRAERLYSWTGTEPESVGHAGENAIAALLAAKKREISLKARGRSKPFEAVIADSLKKMGLIQRFKINLISEQRHEYEVKVQVKGFDGGVDIPDVGFGVSQVLPVLVQCFYAPQNSIVIMEQPEIHLHPLAQSALADVMIDVVNSRENGVDRNVQLLIETHSEHFLRRLQRRVAEEALPEEKVAAYFAKIGKAGSVLEALEIDAGGNIRNWPDNFFGDEMADIAGQAKAALEKRIRQATDKGEETE